jgi:hypothetical protein
LIHNLAAGVFVFDPPIHPAALSVIADLIRNLAAGVFVFDPPLLPAAFDLPIHPTILRHYGLTTLFVIADLICNLAAGVFVFDPPIHPSHAPDIKLCFFSLLLYDLIVTVFHYM